MSDTATRPRHVRGEGSPCLIHAVHLEVLTKLVRGPVLAEGAYTASRSGRVADPVACSSAQQVRSRRRTFGRNPSKYPIESVGPRVATWVAMSRRLEAHAADFSAPAALESAERCRHAGLTLLDGLASGWDIPELASWMAGPYARAALARPSSTPTRPPAAASVRPTAMVLRETRWRLLSALEEAGHASPRWVSEAKLSGSVRNDAELGWVPVKHDVAPLVRRALSLFAADSLLRPGDYRGRSFVCLRCETVSIGATVRCSHGIATDSRSSGYFASTSTAPTLRMGCVRVP